MAFEIDGDCQNQAQHHFNNQKRQPITRKEQSVLCEEGVRMTHWVGPGIRWLLLSIITL